MNVINFKDARQLSSKEIRKKIRLEIYNNHTSGLAANKLQANIVILPNEYANDLMLTLDTPNLNITYDGIRSIWKWSELRDEIINDEITAKEIV